MDYSSIANLPNLGPGSTGDSVKTLQQFLVQNGFLTQDQMNTGPGIYGPKTTAAVAAWQQQAGFNTQGNPGYFGPLSKSYITTQLSAPTSSTTPPPPAPTNTTSSLQKSVLGAVADVAASTAATGTPPLSFADALKVAANDPNIVSKYADMLGLDKQGFSQQLQQLQAAAGTSAQQFQTQFENERTKLAEASAAAGTAYSGFRGEAQKQLAQNENGIVTSSRSQQQDALNKLTSAYEAKYGTGSTIPASLNFTDPALASNVSASGLKTAGNTTPTTLTGELAGNITGTVAPAKAADITSSALQSYQTAQFPNVN